MIHVHPCQLLPLRSKVRTQTGRHPHRRRQPGSTRHAASACCKVPNVWVLPFVFPCWAGTTPASYEGQQCSPAGKPVSEVKLHM